jgi:hypothetical protein
MASKNVELQPFTVPNYVRQSMPPVKRQDGWHEAPIHPLGDLDAETLAQLCDDFRRAVFEKAGKADPSRRNG